MTTQLSNILSFPLFPSLTIRALTWLEAAAHKQLLWLCVCEKLNQSKQPGTEDNNSLVEEGIPKKR